MAIKLLPEAKQTWEIGNVINFIETFKVQKLYKKIYNSDIYRDWNLGICDCDSDIIGALLKKMDGEWILEYVDDNNMGYFLIKKY